MDNIEAMRNAAPESTNVRQARFTRRPIAPPFGGRASDALTGADQAREHGKHHEDDDDSDHDLADARNGQNGQCGA